jgi:hypothetical protein
VATRAQVGGAALASLGSRRGRAADGSARGHTIILFFIRSSSAADPPCVYQKMGDKGILDNATGKWDLQKANLHMYKFAMTREFLAGKLDLPICSSTSQ